MVKERVSDYINILHKIADNISMKKNPRINGQNKKYYRAFVIVPEQNTSGCVRRNYLQCMDDKKLGFGLGGDCFLQ
jgi:hypothetical protein